MNTFIIIFIAWYAIGLLCNAYLHGKKKEGTHNFFHALIATSITLLLLYLGGAFSSC